MTLNKQSILKGGRYPRWGRVVVFLFFTLCLTAQACDQFGADPNKTSTGGLEEKKKIVELPDSHYVGLILQNTKEGLSLENDEESWKVYDTPDAPEGKIIEYINGAQWFVSGNIILCMNGLAKNITPAIEYQ